MLEKSAKGSMGAAKFLLFSFAGLIFIGAFLLKLPGMTNHGIKFVDALFTSTSAVCVTGLATMDTAKDFTVLGQFIILLLIQLGGLGIMQFSATIVWILGQKPGLSGRLALEKSFIQGLDREASLKKFTFFLFKYTFAIELTGALLYFPFLNDENYAKRAFSALFHSVSAFCNAGFSLYSNSLIGYKDSIPVNIITSLLIILGGIGFIVMYEVMVKIKYFINHRKKMHGGYLFSLHTWTVLWTSFWLTLIGAILIFLFEYIHENDISVLSAFFQSITTRTAGFNTLDISSMTRSSLIIMMFLMFIGGSPGSCAGGIKTTTFAIFIFLFFLGKNEFSDVTARGRKIPVSVVYQALLIFLFAAAILFLGAVFLVSLEPHHSFFDLFFESVSAMGTVGLSLGITGSLTTFSKIIIILQMFIGRLGSLTIFSFFLNRKTLPIKYAEEKILIG